MCTYRDVKLKQADAQSICLSIHMLRMGMLQVLILLSMRSTALRVVSRLCELAQKETRADSVQNKAGAHASALSKMLPGF